jgi:hypothetical protein
MPRVIVERHFPAPVTEAEVMAVKARQDDCLDNYNVTWVRSRLSTDRLHMVCEYDAADTESVRKVQREARAKVDRIWPADVFGEM